MQGPCNLVLSYIVSFLDTLFFKLCFVIFKIPSPVHPDYTGNEDAIILC